VYQIPTTTKKEANMPKNLFKVLKNGTMSGSIVSNSRIFQSNVGHGFSPRPLLNPLMVLRFRLFGAIHVIQLNRLRAVKIQFGNQKYTNMQPNAIKKNL
jgi:hypothetical protein